MASSPPQTEHPDYHDQAHSAEMVEYDRFIDEQIDKTSSQVRWVDISAALMTLAAGWLGFLLVATVVDHWLVSGGLGHVARFACFSALVGGTVMFTVWGILPLVVRRINPVYAAHVIEREEPSLKNSLVNFLLLRATPRHLTRKTYQALEESAAHGLAEVPVEHIVDRSHVIKVGYVLMAVIVAGCIYKLVSPKDPLQSVGRIVIPWSDLAPASRVRIDDVKPGSVSVFNGQSIEVSAVVSGAGRDEPVRVVYSTSDTRVVDRPIVMERPEGSFRYVATLPEEIDGLEQDVEYRIEAGDARTSTYRVSVSTPPAMIVTSVQYEYPAYTGLGTRVVQGSGDLKAIEGTRVTIRAEANREIDKAYVDFECDGRTDLAMVVEADGRHATSTFALTMAADGATPAHTSYQLRFAGDDGQENPRPTRHRIEVIPDTPPEVYFELPGYDGVEVPENAAVRLEVHAQDSDFSLGEVTLFAEHNGKQIVERRLLGEPHAGEFVGKHDLRPGKYRLHAGDEVMYWAEARDLRHPVANRTETVHYRMLIVAPTSAPPPEQASGEKQDQQGDSGDASQGDAENQDKSPPGNESDNAGDKKDGGEKDAGEEGASKEGADEAGAEAGDGGKKGDATAGDDRQPGDKQLGNGSSEREAADGKQGDQQRDGERGEAGDKGNKGDKSEPGAGKSGEQDGNNEPREPIDPTSNPGDAFEEILRRREETLESPRDSEGREDNQSDAERNNGQDENAQSKQSPGAEPLGDQTQSNKSPDGGDDASQQQQRQQREQDGNSDQQSAAQPQEGKNQDGQAQAGETKDGQAQDGEPGDGDSAGGASDQSGQQPGDSNNADKRDGEQQDAGDSSAGNEQDSANEPSSSGRPTEGDQQPGAQQGQDPTAGRENQEGSTVENSKRDDPAGSQSQSKKPSEAQGGQQGDRAGRGQQGSGQKANQSGTGGAGQNTASDEGGSASEQAGDGPTGQKPGEKPSQPGQGGKQQAGKDGSAGPSDAHQDGQNAGGNQQGGQPGKHEEGGKPQGGEQQSGQPQQGQQSGDSESGGQSPIGQQPSGQQSGGEQPGGQPGGKQGQPGGQSGQPGQGSQNQGPSGQGAPGQGSPGQGSASTSSNGKSDGSPTTGNNQNTQSNPQQGDDAQGDGTGVGGGEPEADRPLPPRDKDTTALEDEQRLAEAREATNLALEYLRDQLAREKPDPELLKRLGWTRDEMQRFLAHWEEMNRAAQQKGKAGQRASDRLNKMLKGLGISPRARKLSSGIGDDHRRNLASPRRVPPPRGYAEQFKAYTEGAARDRDE